MMQYVPVPGNIEIDSQTDIKIMILHTKMLFSVKKIYSWLS